MGHSDSHYRTLFEFANDAHFVLRDGRFIDVNRRVEEIFERPASELLGLGPWEVSPESQADGRDSREKAEEKLRKALAGTPQIFEWTHVRDDGTIVPVEVSLTRIDLHDGPAVFAVLRDLTERLEAQETIRKSEEQLHLLADLLPGMVARFDTDLRFTFVNRHFQEFLGRQENDVIGYLMADLVSSELSKELAPSLEKALKGVMASAEVTAPSADGSMRILSATYVPEFSKDGDVTGIVALVRDVTKNREVQARIMESEARFRALFQSTPLAVLNTDLAGNILSCNRAFTEMHGTTGGPADQVGRNASEFVHEKDLQTLAEHLGQSLSLGGHTGPTVYTLLKEDGSPFPAEIQATAIRDDEGRPLSVVAHATDITERLRTEAVERQAKEDLRALTQKLEDVREEERVSISRELHDELGQALTTIRIDLGALREKIVKADSSAHADVVALEAAAEETLGAVRGLSARLRPPVLDVLGLGPALEWQAEEISRRTSIEFRLDVPDESLVLPPDLSTAMFRIAQEALTNVVRHASASAVALILTADESELRLTVSDNGVGIDPESTSGSGSLGLVGMRERATNLGGTLVIKPGTDGGTKVFLRVPLPERDASKPGR